MKRTSANGATPPRVAVAGWGNPDRRDDGAAWAVVGRLKERFAGRGEVAFHLDRLLAPETAEFLQGAAYALFVDAEIGAAGVSLRDIPPSDHFRIDLTHHLPAGHLLALCRTLYGAAPQASLLTVPADDLSLGEGLSPACAALIGEAVGLGARWVEGKLG